MEHLLGLPPDGSAHGPQIDHLIGLMHWLMAVLFVGWSTFFIFVLVRFRKRRQPKANYHGVKNHFSSYVEVGVLLAEVILLVGFSIPLWSKRVDAFPAEKDATVIHVVAEQFAWNIHYAGNDGKFGKTSISLIDGDNPLGLDRSDADAKDDITTINQLNIPVNKPVIIYLSTKDVIHSFNLPAFRVKQDAIPGMQIPVWFVPTKTTDEIREELRQKFSIAEIMKKIRTISLPPVAARKISRGSAMDDMMTLRDYTDSSGSVIVAKGERANAENIQKLLDAGISEVAVRPVANMDKYVVLQEYKNDSGTVVVNRNETLSEETVTKLLEAGVKDVPARPNSNMDNYVIMDNIADKSGNPIAAKGDAVTEEMLTKSADAGVSEITIAPATPTEIACAQLCGLGHYRMRGYLNVMTPDQYKRWIDEQEAGLQPPPADSTGTTQSASIDSGTNQKQ